MQVDSSNSQNDTPKTNIEVVADPALLLDSSIKNDAALCMFQTPGGITSTKTMTGSTGGSFSTAVTETSMTTDASGDEAYWSPPAFHPVVLPSETVTKDGQPEEGDSNTKKPPATSSTLNLDPRLQDLLSTVNDDLETAQTETRSTIKTLFKELVAYAEACHAVQQLWEPILQAERAESERLDGLEVDLQQQLPMTMMKGTEGMEE